MMSSLCFLVFLSVANLGQHFKQFGAAAQNVTSTAAPGSSDFKRTVVYIKRETYTSQYVFLRGGRRDGSAIPIKHRVRPYLGRQSRYYEWSQADNYLDWDAQEKGQWNFKFDQRPGGTPLMWTTNSVREFYTHGLVIRYDTVDRYGAGYSPMNKLGPHYWMLDVDMDCSATDYGGWFEMKAFVVNGENSDHISYDGYNGEWEGDVTQHICYGAPVKFSGSSNHIAKCGAVNIFTYNQGTPCLVTHNFASPMVG